ncbi:cysteine--tRNA ligase, cytoplasmic-like [Ruditapes philippinarum]|uniref:cysteine--tRNA ligase, cytoplasmic-like n=1 Tax=Ruditapes philippinarum TaxID=129788 RepID=UPI00295ABBD1|nr:cysteine--tRNA ligase, cytoplasmic-like [Ruditapes philippinarum]
MEWLSSFSRWCKQILLATHLYHLIMIFGSVQAYEDWLAVSGGASTGTVDVEKTDAIFDSTSVLKVCDNLRDKVLQNLGVRLEDKEGQPPEIKLVDRETLLIEKEEKMKQEEPKIKEKELKKQKAEKEKAEKETQKKIPSSKLFKMETDKYSKFDENGLTTHDAEGKELSKSALKKNMKLDEAQEKKYKEFTEKSGN